MPLALAFAAFLLLQQQPPIGDIIQPTDAQAAFTVEGRGDQIYICAQTAQAMQWVLKAPAAILYNAQNQAVGKHGEGPTWTWNDSSATKGTIIGRRPSPDSASIPWLLLSTQPWAGLDATKTGMLDEITYVQRSDTHGGLQPGDGCDAAHIGESRSIPYSATYTFYKRKN